MQVRRSLDECGDDHEAEAKPRHGQRVDSKQFGPGHQRPEYLKEITRMERVSDNYRKTRAQARVFPYPVSGLKASDLRRRPGLLQGGQRQPRSASSRQPPPL